MCSKIQDSRFTHVYKKSTFFLIFLKNPPQKLLIFTMTHQKATFFKNPTSKNAPFSSPSGCFFCYFTFCVFLDFRYGSVFKSHILGCPTIVSMDPELNRFILMNEGKGILPGYPQSMLDILGKSNIAAVHGSAHKNMRGALLSLVSPSVIRDQILSKIDEFMRSHLLNWNNQIIDIQEKTKEVCNCNYNFIRLHFTTPRFLHLLN